jgi:TM2 domain-containing membrane protein YozV
MGERFVPNPGIAAVLSFLLPGLGQFYNGKFLRGIFWLIVGGGVWFGSMGTLGWIVHIVSAYFAYSYALKLQPPR